MSKLTELLAQREYKYMSLVYLNDDIKEYIKSPVDTVCIEQLKYRFDSILCEIKVIDNDVQQILLSAFESSKRCIQLHTKKINLLPKPFDATDLPKNHYSLWENSK